jgi:hypothetical protein
VAKYGLTAKSRNAVPPVLTGPTVRENIPSHGRQATGVVELPLNEKTCIAGHIRIMRFQLEAAVDIHPKSPLFHPTQRARLDRFADSISTI